MERIQSINPERIAWCCSDHGITPSILASELDIASTSIERLMAGEDSLTFNQLRNIAEYFGRGVLFFLEQEPVVEAQFHTPQFRTLANQKPELSTKLKALIERVEKQREVYQSLCEDLGDIDRIRFNPPDVSAKNPREAAHIVREWLGISEHNSFDTYREALEAQGILVFLSNGYSGKWQIAKENPIIGFSLYYTTSPVIVIKKQEVAARQSFTLMHELGHLLLHKISSIDDEQDLHSHKGREREANAFAGHLLVPDAFLESIHDADRPSEVSQFDGWLKSKSKAWGVSVEAILLRLVSNKRLPQTQYDAYKEWKNQIPITQNGRGNREYRYREPKHMFGKTFVRTVLDALYARHITLSKASSYLDNLKITALHQLERHIAGI
jgi:Zn-dependent peptidase ImmA (M78 family)/transcriptional regulator with XRE-family HTH domain